MALNSRAKGRRAEIAFAQKMSVWWPEAIRNLDQFGDDKRDVLHCAGLHFQIKHVERLNIWAALAQAEGEARNGDMPLVAFKRNRSKFYVAGDADDLLPILKLREM